MSRQLPAPSQYLSLTTLMSSERSNDDIQSELVEILGFEGDGLALVEELLRPGIREALINDMRGGGKVSHSDFIFMTRLTCSPLFPSHRITSTRGKEQEDRRRRER